MPIILFCYWRRRKQRVLKIKGGEERGGKGKGGREKRVGKGKGGKSESKPPSASAEDLDAGLDNYFGETSE